MGDEKGGATAKRQYLMQGGAMLFAIAGALAFGFVAGRGTPTNAAAEQKVEQQEGASSALVRQEQNAPCMAGKADPGTLSVPPVQQDALAAQPKANPDKDETGGKPEKKQEAAPASSATRGQDAIARWRGPDATALLFLENGQGRDALAWLVTADLDPARRANLKGRALLAMKDLAGAQAVFQPQVALKNEEGADAVFGQALCAAQGDTKAIPQAALEDLLGNPVDSWGCAMAALEYARRLDAGLLDQALFETKPVGDLSTKGKAEELARYYYQQALLMDRLLLVDECACQKRLQDLTEQIVLDPRRNHIGFGLPTANFHKVEPGDSLTKIAKQYEVTIGSICRLNGLDPKGVLLAGKTLKVVRGEVSLEVDRARLTATLLVDGAYLLRAPVGIGPGEKTPAGRFTIRTKVIKPDWYYGGKRYPFGDPENILGTRWLGFDTEENGGLGAGLGLHGTTIPESVPGRESMGCVRFHNEDVEFIYAFLAQGGTVEIR